VGKRASTLIGTGALMAFGATGIAIAADSGSMTPLSTTGVRYDGGSYRFYYNEPSRDFAVTGNLADTAADGNSVFVQARVAGYSYGGRQYNTSGSGSVVYRRVERDDPAANFVSYADVQACVDRGSAFPDVCVSTRVYR
jgi:hypothetical protein